MPDLLRRNNSRNIEFAIICSSKLESDAVEQLVEDRYEEDSTTYRKVNNDRDIYVFGRLGHRDVVLVHVPASEKTNTGRIAFDLVSTFPSIKICFTVETRDASSQIIDGQHVHLSDVTVSTSLIRIDAGPRCSDVFPSEQGNEHKLQAANRARYSFTTKLFESFTVERLTEKIEQSLPQDIPLDISTDIPGFPYHCHKHWKIDCSACQSHHEDDDNNVHEKARDSDASTLDYPKSGTRFPDRVSDDRDTDSICRTEVSNQTEAKSVLQVQTSDTPASSDKDLDHRGYRVLIKARETVPVDKEGSNEYAEVLPVIVVQSVHDYMRYGKNQGRPSHANKLAAACTKAILEECAISNLDDELALEESGRVPNIPESTSSCILLGQNDAIVPKQEVEQYPVRWLITKPINELFTGRVDVLSDLETVIRDAVLNSQQGRQQQIAISGIGGQGKTELCLQLARRLCTTFWGVFWIDASSESSIEYDYLLISSQLGLDQGGRPEVCQYLANSTNPWLLVLDNANDSDLDYQSYIPPGPRGVVILTFCNERFPKYTFTRWLKLDGLGEESSRNLLSKAAHMAPGQSEAQRGEALAVTRLLQFHPLALILAGSHISHGYCSLDDFPEVFERTGERLQTSRPNYLTIDYERVYTMLEMSFEALQTSDSQISRDAVQLLAILSSFAQRPLPISVLYATQADIAAKQMLQLGSTSALTDEGQESHQRGTSQDNNKARDPTHLMEAIELLRSLALLSKDNQNTSTRISLHPLIHQWLADHQTSKAKYNHWVTAISIAITPTRNDDIWFDTTRSFLPHLQAVAAFPVEEMFSQEPKDTVFRMIIALLNRLTWLQGMETVSDLVNRLTRYFSTSTSQANSQWTDLYYLANTTFAASENNSIDLSLLEQIEQIDDKLLGKSDFRRINTQYELANAYSMSNQPEMAIPLYESVIRAKRRKSGARSRSWLGAGRLLVGQYNIQGQVEEAIALIEEIIEVEQDIFANDGLERRSSLLILAEILNERHEHKTAIDYLETAVELTRNALPEDHPDRLDIEQYLAWSYLADDQVEAAISIYESVQSTQEHTLPKEDPKRYQVAHELARAYSKQGRFIEAVVIQEELVRTQENDLAEQYRYRLVSLFNLSHYYHGAGRVDDAVRSMQMMVDTGEKTTPPTKSSLPFDVAREQLRIWKDELMRMKVVNEEVPEDNRGTSQTSPTVGTEESGDVECENDFQLIVPEENAIHEAKLDEKSEPGGLKTDECSFLYFWWS